MNIRGLRIFREDKKKRHPSDGKTNRQMVFKSYKEERKK